MYQKIILIGLDWTRAKDPPRSLGHASILANLMMHGIPIIERSWSVNSTDFDTEYVINFIATQSNTETCIAFGVFVWNEIHIQNILSEIKYRKIPGTIIIGGPQISYTKPEVGDIEDCYSIRGSSLESFYPQVDIFIRGYAELALAELMLSPKQKAIAGVHYSNTKDNNSLSIVNLSTNTSPLLLGLVQPKKFLRWETKRGCPFGCAFCQHKSPEMRQYHEFPIERIFKEAQWIISHPEIQDIAIVDPTFNIEKTHYLEVLKILISLKYRGKLSLQCRIEFVTDIFLSIVVELNRTAQVILEFGLQTTNKREEMVIKRRNNHAAINRVLKQCIERNIKIEVSLIYGLPLQTVNSFIQSVQFLVNLGVSTIRAWPLMLLRGTKLYEIKKQYNLKETNEIIPRVISSCSFSSEEYKRMQAIADSLEIYNQLAKEDQLQWEVDKQKPHTASLSYAHAMLFFRQNNHLITDDYVIKMRHNDLTLQQIYDERFGVILKT